MIQIDPAKCVRCGACVKDCIVQILKPGKDGVPAVAPAEERLCLNCQHCLAICPTGAVNCNGIAPENCAPVGALPEPETMLHLLRQRRSIRQYRDENLDRATLDQLQSALAWTPTGCNDHRLFFAVIEDKAEMAFFRAEVTRMIQFLIRTGLMRLIYPNIRRYADEIMNGKDVIFRNAPHMIIAATPRKAPCAEADPWIALSYFDLLAQSFGVGTCWCGFAVHALKWSRTLRNRINLPPGYRIGAVLLFGKPAITYARATNPPPFPDHR